MQTTEPIQDKVEEFIKKYDFFRPARESQEKMNNWFLAIAVGFFIFTVSNLNLFIVNGKLIYKPAVLTTIILQSLAIIFIGGVRLVYVAYDFFSKALFSAMKRNKWKADDGLIRRKKAEKKMGKMVKVWLQVHNVTYPLYKTLFLGFFILLGSLVIYIGLLLIVLNSVF